MKNKTCFKSKEGSCIDLVLTSSPNLHQHTQVFEWGMNDHLLIISSYTKLEPKDLHKRQYKFFSKNSFFKDLKFGLSNDGYFSHFNNEFKEILDHRTCIKQTKLCGNTKPHVNEILRKEIMKRYRIKIKPTKLAQKKI